MIEVVETIPSLMFCITVTIDVKEGWHGMSPFKKRMSHHPRVCILDSETGHFILLW
jgi:hypothetical protein